MPSFRKAYDKSSRYTFSTTGPSLTHQSMAPECDINTIMKKYEKTGILEHRNNFEGQYADFTNTPSDYHESMNAVIAADEMFQTLPSGVRRRFHNDPGYFLDFVGNPANQDEIIKLGLATRVPEPDLVDPATPTPKKASTPSKAAPAATPSPSDGD
jgi:phage internal scaffolding protein